MTNLAFFPGNFSDLANISFKRLETGPHKSKVDEIGFAKTQVSNFLQLAGDGSTESILVQNALRKATQSLVKIDDINNHPYLAMAYNDYTRSLDQKHTDDVTDAPPVHMMSRLKVAKKLTESLKQIDLHHFQHKLKNVSEKDIEDLVKDVDSFDDIHHLYSDEELTEEVLEEHISRQERNQKRIRFNKTEKKRELKRDIALKRLSPTSKLLSKARTLAIKLLKEKMLHKDYADMSIVDKERVEDIIANRKDVIARMVVKLVPRIRKIEQDRLRRHVKEEVEPLEEVLIMSPSSVSKDNKLGLTGYLGSDHYENVEEQREQGKRDFKDLGEFKEMHAHMVHNEMFPNEGFMVFAHNKYHNGDPKTSLSMEGQVNPDDKNTLHVETTASNGDNANKAHHLYEHLILNHGKTLVSDTSQSEGGLKIWQKLAQHPDIHVHGWDEYHDKHFDLKDPSLNDVSETHMRKDDLSKEDWSERTAQINKFRHISLVAHRK